MISPEYCVTMARYARWHNRQIITAVSELDLGTAKRAQAPHVQAMATLCARQLGQDYLWLGRLDAVEVPALDVLPHDEHIEDWDCWRRDRQQLDAHFVDWAKRQTRVMLEGELFWYSPQDARAVSHPVWMCISHVFTLQTALRGAVVAHLGMMGKQLDVGNVLSLPQDLDWV